MAALPIILKILKIIGIVLLCVIGLVLLNVILVLFVPVRYKVQFVRTGVEGDDPVNARGYVSWLLHIVHVSLAYPSEAYAVIRVFGIPVARIPQDEETIRKEEEKQKKKEEAARKKAEGSGEPSSEAETDGASEEPGFDDQSDFFEHDDQDNDEGTDSPGDGPADSDTEAETVTDEDQAEEQRKSIFSRIKDLIHKIKCTIRDICDKIKKIADDLVDKTKSTEEKLQSIKKDIDYYHKILTSELFERTFAKCKKKVLRFLRSILPRKGDIKMEMGFDDPYTTGEVLAIAAMMQPVTGRFLHVYGNFDESIIRGGGYLKGRIFIFMVVKLILLYFLDRDLKTLIKLFKKEPVKKKGRRTDRRKT